MKYFVHSTHAETLHDGRTVAPGEEVEFSSEEENDAHNQKLIEHGILSTEDPNADEGREEYPVEEPVVSDDDEVTEDDEMEGASDATSGI